MNQENDRDLRDRFLPLRQEDAGGAPPLAAVLAAARRMGRAPARPGRWVPVLAVVALAVALLIVSVLGPNGQRQPLVDLAAARWQGPTDFLLRVPGAEYLETLPTFTVDWRNR